MNYFISPIKETSFVKQLYLQSETYNHCALSYPQIKDPNTNRFMSIISRTAFTLALFRHVLLLIIIIFHEVFTFVYIICYYMDIILVTGNTT